MAQKTKQWGAIIVMIALFAMIAFVTNLCTPMATIIKNQGEISNVLAQIGNYAFPFVPIFFSSSLHEGTKIHLFSVSKKDFLLRK